MAQAELRRIPVQRRQVVEGALPGEPLETGLLQINEDAIEFTMVSFAYKNMLGIQGAMLDFVCMQRGNSPCDGLDQFPLPRKWAISW